MVLLNDVTRGLLVLPCERERTLQAFADIVNFYVLALSESKSFDIICLASSGSGNIVQMLTVKLSHCWPNI